MIGAARDGIPIHGCGEDPTAGQDLQFVSSFDVEQPLDAAWANDWNLQWAAGRAMVEADGDLRLGGLVPAAGGPTGAKDRGVLDHWNGTPHGFAADGGWRGAAPAGTRAGRVHADDDDDGGRRGAGGRGRGSLGAEMRHGGRGGAAATAGPVGAHDPRGLVAAIQAMGHRATRGTDDAGDPKKADGFLG